MNYIKISEAADKWDLSTRRVRVLCSEGKIPGVVREGKLYYIPEDASRPRDGRFKKPTLFDEIAEKQTELAALRPLTPGEVARLQEEFLVEFTYNSTAIEGNTLTLQETAMAIAGITVDEKPLKDHLEAVGHRDAFLFVLDIAKKELPLSESIIRQIHSLVLMDRPEDRGVFRRVPVRIMGAATEPVQPYLIEPKLTELLLNDEDRKASMNVFERIARFHLEFEGIHPFIDGNGRTGRLILNLDLIRNGFPPINVKFTDRRKYYDAFRAFSETGSAEPMTELIAGYVNEQLEGYIRILQPLS